MGKSIYDLPQFRHLESFMHVVSDTIDMCSISESEPMVRVPHESAPGFMPFTDGGLTKDFFFNLQDHVSRDSNSMGISYPGFPRFPVEIEKMLADRATNAYISCVSAFASDEIGDEDQSIATVEDADAYLASLDDRQNMDYENFSSGYGISDSRFRVRVGFTYKESEEYPLYFFVSLNVDDPYFREQGDFRHQTGGKEPVDFLLWSEAMKIDNIPVDDSFSFTDLARAHEMVSVAMTKEAASGKLMVPLLLSAMDEYSEGLHSEDPDLRTQYEQVVSSALLEIEPDASEYIKDVRVFACGISADGPPTSRPENFFPPYHASGWNDVMIQHRDLAPNERRVAISKGIAGLHRENAEEVIENDVNEGWTTKKQAREILADLGKSLAERNSIISGQPIDKAIGLMMQPLYFGSHVLGVSEFDLDDLRQALTARKDVAEAPHVRG